MSAKCLNDAIKTADGHLNPPCPRCGKAFVCNPSGHGACPYFEARLSPVCRERIARAYTGCLCLECLNTLAAEKAHA